jgi:hypothetical protein
MECTSTAEKIFRVKVGADDDDDQDWLALNVSLAICRNVMYWANLFALKLVHELF